MDDIFQRAEKPPEFPQDDWQESARVGLHHRALPKMGDDKVVWFWFGPHEEYERLIK
ncbi:MAG: hypothetical protein ACREH8_07760 [Opitutaceae bacterium]